jgi:signal transduction histidine kinase
MRSPRVEYLARLALFAAAYLVLAKVGLRVATVGRSVTLVWPPTGLALAALLLGSLRLWPAIAVAAFVVNATTPGVGPLVAALIAVGNTLEAVVGASLVRRHAFRAQLDSTRDVVRFTFFGAAVATSVSATFGALALRAGGLIPTGALFATWRVWWIGDAMGALVVAPALLCWASPTDELERPRAWEPFVLAPALIIASLGVLTQPHSTRPYLVFPPLIWAALRFGPRGATTATLFVSLVTVASTITGRGAFAVSSIGENLVALEAFLAAVAITAMLLGAVASERQRAIRAHENFISIASHELRTPLAPMRLQVQRLLRELGKDSSSMPRQSVIDSLRVIDRQSARLATLLENVLDMTQLRLGRLPLHPETVDASVLVDEIASMLREPLAEAGCSLSVETRGSPTGQWDRARLGQVLMNLLANAAKHGGHGPIEVSLNGGPSHTTIVVRDHGPGVEPQERDRIFGRFEHVDTRRPGLGLGLYVAREIVAAHGGRLTLENPPDGGAAFEIDLPARTPGDGVPSRRLSARHETVSER